MSQQLSVIEWLAHWDCCWRDLETTPLSDELRQQSQLCLQRLARFSREADLRQLDRCLAELRQLRCQWDHWWWVAERSARPWPAPRRPASELSVTRQNGRSRISWSCRQCGWSLSWDVPVPAWERLDWPGPIECPLGCSTTSCDVQPGDESPRSESGL